MSNTEYFLHCISNLVTSAPPLLFIYYRIELKNEFTLLSASQKLRLIKQITDKSCNVSQWLQLKHVYNVFARKNAYLSPTGSTQPSRHVERGRRAKVFSTSDEPVSSTTFRSSLVTSVSRFHLCCHTHRECKFLILKTFNFAEAFMSMTRFDMATHI